MFCHVYLQLCRLKNWVQRKILNNFEFVFIFCLSANIDGKTNWTTVSAKWKWKIAKMFTRPGSHCCIRYFRRKTNSCIFVVVRLLQTALSWVCLFRSIVTIHADCIVWMTGIPLQSIWNEINLELIALPSQPRQPLTQHTHPQMLPWCRRWQSTSLMVNYSSLTSVSHSHRKCAMSFNNINNFESFFIINLCAICIRFPDLHFLCEDEWIRSLLEGKTVGNVTQWTEQRPNAIEMASHCARSCSTVNNELFRMHSPFAIPSEFELMRIGATVFVISIGWICAVVAYKQTLFI